MASQVIACDAPTALATPTLRVFADGSDTQVSGSPFTLVEATNRKGYYSVSFTGTLDGLHSCTLYSGASPIGRGWVRMVNADGTYYVEQARAVANVLETIAANVVILLARITSTLFSGITSLAQWLGLLAGKQSGNSTARTELRATGAASGTFDETTDSLEAQKDDVNARLPAALVGGRMDSYVGAVASGVGGLAAAGSNAQIVVGGSKSGGIVGNVNQGSTFTINVYSQQSDGSYTTPSTLRYKRHDAKTGTQLKAWTTITPGNPSVLTLAAADNILHDSTRNAESHILTMEATFSGGAVATAEWTFQVEGLKHL